ncbi:MAG: hypothetical protein AAF620_08170 [Bacteroidota bacterium]
MKKYSFVLILFLYVGCSDEKDNTLEPYPSYYHLIRGAKLDSKNGNITSALEKFAEAIEIVDYVHTHNFVWAAKEAKNIGNCKLAAKYIEKALRQGITDVPENLTDEGLLSDFLDCEMINKAQKSELIAMLKKDNSQINFYLKDMLDSLYNVDQRIRNEGSRSEIKRIDSLNINMLIDLINKFGFPDERLIGAKTAKNTFIIILHFDSDTDNCILGGMLFNALHKGKLAPQNYAWVVDRRRYWGPEKQEPYYYEIPTQKLKNLTKKERDEIDKRRYAIGLKPLSEMNISFKEDGRVIVTDHWTDF